MSYSHIVVISFIAVYVSQTSQTSHIQFELIAECQTDAKFHLSFIVNRIFTCYNMYTINTVVVGFFPLEETWERPSERHICRFQFEIARSALFVLLSLPVLNHWNAPDYSNWMTCKRKNKPTPFTIKRHNSSASGRIGGNLVYWNFWLINVMHGEETHVRLEDENSGWSA